MTGAETITKFINMVDDVIDSDFAYQLLNDAKDLIEGERIWEQLKAVDSSQTATQGETQSTTHALPTRFALPIKLMVGDDYQPYDLINFEDQRNYRDNSRGFFIDQANGTYALTGTVGKTATIYLYHTKYSADITSGTSWAFPSRFHTLLPYKMAQIYYAADAGEKSRSWDDRWALYYDTAFKAMEMWDAQLKMRAKSIKQYTFGPDPRVAFY